MGLNAVQNTVALEPTIGAAGGIYDSGQAHDIQSYVATTPINFGDYVKITGQYCAAVASSGDVTGHGGIAVKSNTFPTGVGYVAGDVVPVMTFGRVWVVSETAMTVNTAPYARFTANTSPTRPVGGWLNGADSGKAVQPTDVTIYRGSAAGGPVVLEINKVGNVGVGATGGTGATGPTGP